jgi:hypothetical protein
MARKGWEDTGYIERVVGTAASFMILDYNNNPAMVDEYISQHLPCIAPPDCRDLSPTTREPTCKMSAKKNLFT